MPRDFLPRRDADLIEWAANFGRRIALDRDALGISESMLADYQAANDSFAAAYAITADPARRTSPAVCSKNESRASLEAQIRMLGRLIRARPNVSPAMRIELGLSQRDGGGHRPRAARPDTAPALHVARVVGQTIHLQLRDVANLTGRARPENVRGATVLTFIGEHAPADASEWSFACHARRTSVAVPVRGNIPPGSKVWITALWTNSHHRPSPAATPIFAHTQFAVTRNAA